MTVFRTAQPVVFETSNTSRARAGASDHRDAVMTAVVRASSEQNLRKRLRNGRRAFLYDHDRDVNREVFVLSADGTAARWSYTFPCCCSPIAVACGFTLSLRFPPLPTPLCLCLCGCVLCSSCRVRSSSLCVPLQWLTLSSSEPGRAQGWSRRSPHELFKCVYRLDRFCPHRRPRFHGPDPYRFYWALRGLPVRARSAAIVHSVGHRP